ncbi:MAG: hypothetical protein AB7S26_40915 [Sandaracinaceae bacterium]
MESPNIIAWAALALVGPFAFFAFWRWPPLKAAMIVMFGSAMFLPSNIGFKAPILPDLDKEYLPAAFALVACIAFKRHALAGSRPFRGPEVLVLVAMLGAVFTAMTNTDPLVYGPTRIPGEGAYDALNDAVEVFLKWFPPFYLGRALVRRGDDLEQLIRFLVFCGLVYSLPILFELRMSPQLHNWIYGFHQSEFIQTIRWGGYRPKVFMRHGLNVALFMTICCLAAVALYKAKLPLRKFWTPGRAAIFLFVIVVLCKSTGAYFHLLVLVPLFLFTGPRAQRLVAIGAVLFILAYPLTRAMDWIPIDEMIEWMSVNVDEERARSLWFRFFTEGQILENTRDRLLFGWGGYSRPFEFDPVTGEMLSVVDGYWTIELGTHGLWGFFCIFGLVLTPIVMAFRAIPKIADPHDRRLVAMVALLAALYVFDWLPNSSISADLTFMVGGLAGGISGILREQRRQKLLRRRARAEKGRERRTSGDKLPAVKAAPAR